MRPSPFAQYLARLYTRSPMARRVALGVATPAHIARHVFPHCGWMDWSALGHEKAPAVVAAVIAHGTIPTSVPTACFLADHVARELLTFSRILWDAPGDWLAFWMTMADRFAEDMRTVAVRIINERIAHFPEDAEILVAGLRSSKLAAAFLADQAAGTLHPRTVEALQRVQALPTRGVLRAVHGAEHASRPTPQQSPAIKTPLSSKAVTPCLAGRRHTLTPRVVTFPVISTPS